MKYVLGIDVGGTMAKAALFSVAGDQIAVSSRKFENLCPGPDRQERDPAAFKTAVLGVIHDLIKESGVSNDCIKGIAVTGQANGLYLVDANGNATHPFILSSDTRAKEIVKEWYQNGTFQQVLPKIRESVWAGQVNSLVAWFAQNHPDVLEKTAYCLTAKDYVRFLLTGEFCLEATESPNTNIIDQNTGALSPDLFRAFGIEQYIDRFPKRICGSTEIAGYVSPAAAQATGLKEKTPVMGGLIDTMACGISTGIVDEDRLCVVIGSWSINSYIDPNPIVDERLFSCYPYCFGNYHYITEGSATSASNLEWFLDQFMQEERAKGNLYGQINEMVAALPYRSANLFFLPFLFGSNANVDAKAAFVGLTGAHTKAEMLKAIYEGVAFCHLYHIEKLMGFRKQPFKAARVAGGGTKSEPWMRIFANVLNLPVEVTTADELGAMGVAMAASVGIGEYANMKEASAAFTKLGKTYLPDPQWQAYYAQKYAAYKKLIHCLDPFWADLAALS